MQIFLFCFTFLLVGLANAAEIIDLRNHPNALRESRQTLSNTQNIQLKTIQTTVDQQGHQHTRYQQCYKTVCVWGHQVIEHSFAAPKSQAQRMARPSIRYSGQFIKGIPADLPDVTPAKNFDQHAALRHAKRVFEQAKGSARLYSREKSELILYLDEDNKTRLAYVVSFFADAKQGGHPARPFFIIDAKTKKTLKAWNGLAHKKIKPTPVTAYGPGGNEKIGIYEYGEQGYPVLDVTQITKTPKRCLFENEWVRTVNFLHYCEPFDDEDCEGKSGNVRKSFLFNCERQTKKATNGAQSPLNDAHFNASLTVKMYEDWYGTFPLHKPILARVHYGEDYENAFWDGESITFGDGGTYFYPFSTALDVVAHEISHGVTERHSGLLYFGQPGGINEAFSDMAGEAAKYYFNSLKDPSCKETHQCNDWKVGFAIGKHYFFDVLRYMDEPTKDDYSIDHVDDYFDFLDVHQTSGLFNKAFYLMATHEGWDTKKAFDVMLHANLNYWTPVSTFESAAQDVLQSARDLGYDTGAIVQAFEAIGLYLDS